MGRSLPKGWRHRPSPPAWPGGEPKLRPQNGTRPDLSRLLDRPLEACSAEASRSLYLSKRPLAPSSDRVTRPDEPSAGSQWWKALFLVLSIFFPPLQWRPWFSGVGKGRWLVFSIKHDLARSCFQLWPKMARFWGPKLKTWSRQIMFYVIYPELWKLLKKMEIL